MAELGKQKRKKKNEIIRAEDNWEPVGHTPDLAEQGLSTLKHHARHLKTMTLCKYYYPHASYSLPNLKDGKWKEFLESLITNLKENAI
jgi:CO dehydrogenase/acetyl-CoA synthase epsilon subunit